MSKVAIVTDSNSGITQSQGKELGIYVIPMPFYINEELFLEDISLSQKEFYERLSEDADIKTSQPSPADVLDLWNEILETHDEIIHIPMSSALSSTCATAQMLAEDFDGKVKVVDNQRISITMKQSVMDAIQLANMGKSAQEIHDILMREKLEASIYITVDTLKYLKKGGRITPTAAAIGAVLNIKPVLQVQGGKLDSYDKCRGIKSAKKSMLNAIAKDLDDRFAGKDMHLCIAYTCTEEEALQWKQEVEAKFQGYEITMDPLSLSVSCHIGAGSMAIACCHKVPELA